MHPYQKHICWLQVKKNVGYEGFITFSDSLQRIGTNFRGKHTFPFVSCPFDWIQRIVNFNYCKYFLLVLVLKLYRAHTSSKCYLRGCPTIGLHTLIFWTQHALRSWPSSVYWLEGVTEWWEKKFNTLSVSLCCWQVGTSWSNPGLFHPPCPLVQHWAPHYEDRQSRPS